MRAVPLRLAICALTALSCTLIAPRQSTAAPLSSAFTYQGELFADGQPAVGSFDLRFTPYVDASNPTLLGPPVVVENVLVSAGVFTTQVDFGPGFFVGDAVFLEIAVRPFDSVDPNAFDALAPRQEITATPYSLKPAPGSVTDIELAADAVGSPQLANNSVASADLTDGSIAPADLSLAGGGFDTTFWRVGGNTGSAGIGLGTLDNQPLALFSPIGVTINGARANDNTELTLRGNSSTPETNVDLTLWPRAGEAFFNLGVIGATPADTRFVIHSVGTAPFTGFLPRAQMNFDGALGLGGQDPNPLARLHVTRFDQGLEAAEIPEQMELILEDVDAQMGLYSQNNGQAGSVIGLAEMDPAGAFVNQWGLYRRTTPGNAALQLSFGTSGAAAANPVLFHFNTNASLGIGAAPINSDLELFVQPSTLNPDAGVDIAMQPRGGDHLFDLGVKGTNATDTNVAFYFAGPSANFEPRMRVTGTGSFGAGKRFTLAHGGAFVFADDSSSTPVATTAANQFLVRAIGGVAINGIPDAGASELTIRANSTTNGSTAEIGMYPGGTAPAFRIGVGGTAGFLVFDSLNSAAPDPISRRFQLSADGDLSLNPATAGGGIEANGFPLKVGTTGNSTNGNGAHVTNGGIWTNTSGRAFKEAFTAIDVGDVLERVVAMPITRWRYRGDDAAWHLGPVAEDFRAAFGLGESEQYIGTVDADGVALAAIQGLHARVETRARALELENAALRESLAELVQRVSALERGD